MAERSFKLLLMERYKYGNYDWYRQDFFLFLTFGVMVLITSTQVFSNW